MLDLLEVLEVEHALGRPTPLDHVLRIVIFVVNSLSDPATHWDRTVDAPGAFAILMKATGVPIEHFSYEAIELLRPQLNRAPWDPLLQRSFARACELAGEEVRAGEAHAEVALLNGQFSDALNQLVDLLRRDDVDYYQRARIEARIAEITPYALEQRRRLGPGEA